ncbi:tetratricopeptide repeat-containing sensor histidine kinase [Reichenbachiella agarivorans]|uniref:histidine kinase n=1 Tax=Reichenbachiella agarivorans TaxID=2979464 RepID=A0ABY6CTN7_9BACT|nr:tetratricopeptide repeat-containing sensor histidine kinase [Reichenbachiella agarivorans]UXP31605.1 tetratricopeptide repeat-containing sensor histidine kinase [Reichenbachiella agarivorans]
MRKYSLLLLFTIGILPIAISLPTSKQDSLVSVLNTVSGIQKLEILMTLGSFKTGEFSRIKDCVDYAGQAKILAKELNEQSSYIRALMLEGEAISGLGNKSAGMDNIQKAIQLAKELPNDTIQAEAYTVLGLQQEANEDLKSALLSYTQSRDLCISMQDTLQMSYAINNMANAHFHMGNMVNALELYHEALELKQIINDVLEFSGAYNNLAMVYKNLGNYDKALEYSMKSLPILFANKNAFRLSLSYLNIGNIQRHLKQYDSALYYHNMALDLSMSIDDTVGFAYAYYNIGSTYYSKAAYEKSVTFYLKALEIFKAQNIKSTVIACYNSLSTTYRKWGKLEEATYYALQGLKLAKEIEHKDTQRELYETLYYTYKEKGDYKKALEYHEQFFAYTDSLLNDQKLKDISQLETNFEISQRDNEINLLSKTNELNALQLKEARRTRLFLIFGSFLLLIVALVFYWSYKSKQTSEKYLSVKNKQLKELNAAKDKFFAIIAHDLRNPLSAFKSLSTALSENFKHLSESELQRYLYNLKNSSEELVNLLHNLLQWALSQTDTLKPNHQSLNLNKILIKNIQLLQENAEQKDIKITTHLSDDSEAFVDAPTIDLVFRNLISNAIKFTSPGGTITISTTTLDDKVKVAIEDTGIGMTEADTKKLFSIVEDTSTIGQSKEKGTGLGLILCKEFVNKNNGEISVKSELGKGSRFDIKLPINKIKKVA